MQFCHSTRGHGFAIRMFGVINNKPVLASRGSAHTLQPHTFVATSKEDKFTRVNLLAVTFRPKVAHVLAKFYPQIITTKGHSEVAPSATAEYKAFT